MGKDENFKFDEVSKGACFLQLKWKRDILCLGKAGHVGCDNLS